MILAKNLLIKNGMIDVKFVKEVDIFLTEEKEVTEYGGGIGGGGTSTQTTYHYYPTLICLIKNKSFSHKLEVLHNNVITNEHLEIFAKVLNKEILYHKLVKKYTKQKTVKI